MNLIVLILLEVRFLYSYMFQNLYAAFANDKASEAHMLMMMHAANLNLLWTVIECMFILFNFKHQNSFNVSDFACKITSTFKHCLGPMGIGDIVTPLSVCIVHLYFAQTVMRFSHIESCHSEAQPA